MIIIRLALQRAVSRISLAVAARQEALRAQRIREAIRDLIGE